MAARTAAAAATSSNGRIVDERGALRGERRGSASVRRSRGGPQGGFKKTAPGQSVSDASRRGERLDLRMRQAVAEA